MKLNIAVMPVQPADRRRPVARSTQVTASGQDVTITTKGPWVALPSYFVDYAPCGFMFSPKWLGSLEDLPQRDPKSPGYDADAGGDAGRR